MTQQLFAPSSPIPSPPSTPSPPSNASPSLVASPAHLAIRATEGTPSPWLLYEWVALLNRKLLECAARRIRFLIVEAPVRHGKSELASKYLPAWWLGTFPDDRVILSGHNAEFAASFGRATRDVLREWGPALFGVSVSPASSAADRWDLAGNRGGLIAVGVGNPPTGRGGDLIVIDDPIKSAEEAYSSTYRERLWRWWQFDLRSRLEPNGVIVLVMSRWHDDDLVGRLLRRQSEGTYSEAEGEVDSFEVLHLPALADPALIESDPLGRSIGEALCPERYDRATLLGLRDGPNGVGPIAFQALYQNSPRPTEGGIFKRGDFQFADVAPAEIRLTRYWDLAATAAGSGSRDPDWTVGVLLGSDPEGFTWIVDVARIRAEVRDTEVFLRETAANDADLFDTRRVRFPQDPGQAGKAQKRYLLRHVWPGFDAKTYPQMGNKVARAMPFAGQLGARNVVLVRGTWNEDFVEEVCAFPTGAHDDIVDAAAAGYSESAGLLRRKFRIIV